ncbi:hypothetical protein KIW84_053040 [Lathyrus oleraceus]|uniref:Uncharacterized protein n=1 Tax=Pisum sativum TaxID=3888 RepID=A0A9D4WRN5_PEA|nr:hypothetical protein KIW84_053040 [Pisum sativum]
MIMTKEKEFEEEEKTTSEDEEEYYVESLKYNEIMELISDAQLLKTMLNVGSSYPKLIKEFMVKNDGRTLCPTSVHPLMKLIWINVGAFSPQLVVFATTILYGRYGYDDIQLRINGVHKKIV